MTRVTFENAEEALKWAVEVLRRRRLPKKAGFWREIEAEAEWIEATWIGPKNLTLPTDPDERMEVALNVLEGLSRVGVQDEQGAKLLSLWAWGDWADEGRLAAALAIQEKCRRDGMRVRLSYRYTYAQLGEMLGCDRKVAWRKVQAGLSLLGAELVKAGLIDVIDETKSAVDNFKKDVYLDEFKLLN